MKNRIIVALVALAIAICSFPAFALAASYKAYGIDVSRHNGELDFGIIKTAGKDFVIIRAGYSGTKDVNFEKNYKNAKAAGMHVGVYIYSYAENVNEAKGDARDMLSWLSGKQLDYPVFFDIEDKLQEPLSTKTRTDMCLAFISEMRNNGYLAGVYASEYWLNSRLDYNAISGSPIWIAKWTNTGKDSLDMSSYNMWQYTNNGRISPHSCQFDLNVSYTDYPTYIKKNGLNGYPLPDIDPKLPFTDVKMSAWYYDSVKYCYENSLFNGTASNTFSPNINMTRGMFVTVLGRISCKQKPDPSSSPFTDVKKSEYYAPYIEWARQNGIVSGMSPTKFQPDSPITREQMCHIICNYAKAVGIELGSGADISFTDDALISDWAHESVLRLTGAGIIKGMGGGIFSPKTYTTRAQCATLIKRIA